MEISITWNICRVCLQEQSSSNGEPMKLIFCDDNKLAQQIYDCSGITMKPNDSLPNKICQKCISVLKYALHFRKTCRNSDTYLQSILQRTKAASNIFKPEISTVFENENLIQIPLEELEKEPNHENLKTQKRKRCGSGIETKTLKKLKIKEIISSDIRESKKKNTKIVNEANNENLVSHKNDTIFDDSNKNVELEEEIVELEHPSNSEQYEETKEIQDSHTGSKTNLRSTSANFTKFIYENEEFTKLSAEDNENKTTAVDSEGEAHDEYDLIETQEPDMQNLKEEDNEDLYYIYKEIKNENPVQEDRATHDNSPELNDDGQIDEIVEHEDENPDTDDNVDFIPIDEEEHEIMLQLDQDAEDSQSQVTSTVITNDDDGNVDTLNEQNSNSSNEEYDLRTEYIIDEYLIEDTNSNHSSQNSYTPDVKKENNSAKFPINSKRNPVVLAQRRKNKTNSTRSKGAKELSVCILCGNHFNNRQLLNAHMKVHRQEKNHECEICFKRFITACNLQAHMRIHTGEKPFECQHCGRRFSDRSSNLRHERTHTNEKPFHCDQCGKSFTLSTTLQAHLKVHTNERSHKCETCAKSFKLPHQLKAHQNTTLHKAVEQLVKL